MLQSLLKISEMKLSASLKRNVWVQRQDGTVIYPTPRHRCRGLCLLLMNAQPNLVQVFMGSSGAAAIL